MAVEQILRTGSQLLSSSLGASKSAFGILYVILLVLGVNELILLVAFECPCMQKNISTGSDSILLNNTGYVWFFIAMPTGIVFFGSFVVTLSVKKCLTGCCNNENRHCCCLGCYYFSCQSFCNIVGNILFPPGLWLAVSFIDGEYFACAMTPQPYELLPGKSCSDLPRQKTQDYVDNIHLSQEIGWGIAGGLMFLYFLYYLITMCCKTSNYFQSTINDHLREKLEEGIRKELAEVSIKKSSEDTQSKRSPKTFMDDLFNETETTPFLKKAEQFLSDDFDVLSKLLAKGKGSQSETSTFYVRENLSPAPPPSPSANKS